MEEEKPVLFSPHAKKKLRRLMKVGVSEEKVVETVRNPEKLVFGYFGRKVAQSELSLELLLRVVYEETDNKVLILTLYPSKRRRYK